MRTILKTLVVLVLLPLVIPLAIFVVAIYLVHGAALNAIVWLLWCTRGKHVLLVYSDSPIWHDYIEENIIPHLPRSGIVLNWSERLMRRWHSLAVMVARYFGGSREFNPIVVVFRPFRWAKTFRFWQAFKDYKHGNNQTLDSVQRDLFAYIARTEVGTAT